MTSSTAPVDQPPDFLVYQTLAAPCGEPPLSSALVGIAWRRSDGALDIQFSTRPKTGLVKLSPHNTAKGGNHAP